jgi:hypothetical protein
MKVTLFLLIAVTITYAQNNHTYFPHHIGNLWQWLDNRDSIITQEFIRDSIDQSGCTYIHTGDTSSPFTYWHWKISAGGDSVFYHPFKENLLKYKFPVEVDEVWMSSGTTATVREVFEITLFGITTTVAHLDYAHPDSAAVLHEYFAYGIGLNFYVVGSSSGNLAGSLINGIILGQVILNTENEVTPELNSFELFNNYPNPFNPVTNIEYQLSEPAFVYLRVYNTLGEQVKILVNEMQNSGRYSVRFNAEGLTSGVYFYKIESGDMKIVKNMILMK